MVKVSYQEKVFDCEGGETVLEALLKNGVKAPYSCQQGVCQACMIQAVEGEVPESAQQGLSQQYKDKNYFLACLCQPEQDLSVAYPKQEDLCMRAMVMEKKQLAKDIYSFVLQSEKPLDYKAGQFINFHHRDDLIRSYSLASHPKLDRRLEIQVKRKEGGELSNWMLDELKARQVINIQGPNGDSYYRDDDPDGNILMVGTGSGLAPLLGIARDALYNNHRGQIYLYHGSRKEEGLYAHERLQALADEYDNFHYAACVSGEPTINYLAGRASDIALERHPDLTDWTAYLCGDPAMVADTTDKVREAGAIEVVADPFEYTELRDHER
jgi:ferredoxin-NADP reductase